VCVVQNRTARCFINASGLHTNQTVFYEVSQTNAIFAAQLVQGFNDLNAAHFLAVDGSRDTLFKVNGYISRLVRSINRRNAQFEEAFLFILRFICRIFQIQTFVRQMPQVLILGVVGFPVNLQRNVVCFCIVDFFVTALDRPFSPRSDDLHIRSICLDCQFKPNLVVTLTGCTMADCVCTFFECDFSQPLADDRSCKRSTQQIPVFINSTSLYSREYIIVYEFILQIQNDELRSTGLDCLFFQSVQFCTLSNVSRNSDDFAVIIIFFQPRNNDGCIQSARISQNDFFNFLCHRERLHFCFQKLSSATIRRKAAAYAVTAFYYTRFFGNVKHFCINMHEKFLLTALFWIIFILNEYFGAFFCIYAFPMHKAHKNRKRCPPLQQSRHSVSSDETFHFLQILQTIGSGIRSFIGCQNFTDK